jgi:hypothetical protein
MTFAVLVRQLLQHVCHAVSINSTFQAHINGPYQVHSIKSRLQQFFRFQRYLVQISTAGCFSGDYRVSLSDNEVSLKLPTQITISLKSTVFWDMTPCSPLNFNRRFGGTYRLHLQGRRNKYSGAYLLLVRWFSPWVLTVSFCHTDEPMGTEFQSSAYLLLPVIRLADYSACHLLAC